MCAGALYDYQPDAWLYLKCTRTQDIEMDDLLSPANLQLYVDTIPALGS